MNKTLYSFAIFTLGLYVLICIFQNILQFQIGPRISGLYSFLPWFLQTELIYLAGLSIMLRYFQVNRIWYPFLAIVVVIISAIVKDFILYNALSTREFKNLYIPSYIAFLTANVLFGLSLVFSRAGNRRSLKIAGILFVMIGLILVFTTVQILVSADFPFKLKLQKLNQALSWFVSIVPAFFILNFWRERKFANADIRGLFSMKVATITMIIMGLAAVFSCLFLGYRLALQSSVAIVAHGFTAQDKKNADQFESRFHVGIGGDTLRYRVLRPLRYNPEKKYPLVVCLHHGGAHGTDNINQIGGSDALVFSENLNHEKYPAFLLVPQCPEGVGWWDSKMDLMVTETIGHLETEFSIDHKRLYVTGSSGGGYGSWHFIGKHPKMFAAAIPRCGAGATDDFKNMVEVAIWAFHGDKDEIVPVSGSRKMIDAIRKAGGKPNYTEYPNVGHDIGNVYQNNPGLLDWLFSQKRE